MTLRCSTLTIFWAARLWLGWLLLGPLFGPSASEGVAVARAEKRSRITAVPAGREGDVVLAASDEVPAFGPHAAPLTFDLFLPFGHRATATELARYLWLLGEEEDIRLRLHPVLGSEVAERGSELLLAAFDLAGSDSARFLIAVSEHPEWLTDWPGRQAGSDASAQLGSDRRRDGDLSLLAAAREHGIDVAQLRRRLTTRQHQASALSLWQHVRAAVRTPPEVWINGRRLRGPITDAALREEMERQRRRAYQLLRAGTPLRGLYEELLTTVDNSDRSPAISPGPMPASMTSRLLGTRLISPAGPSLPTRPRTAATPTTLDLADMPLRGPRVSPVTLVLVGSLESGPVCELARELRDTLRPYAEIVRFAYLPAPNGSLFLPTSPLATPSSSSSALAFGERSSRVPLILSALALENSGAFFRTYDALIDLMRRRFMLSPVEFAQSILNQRVDFDRLEEQGRSERVRALVLRTQRDARALGATSLPALFLNGRLVPMTGGTSGLGIGGAAARSEQLTRLIEAELHRGALEKLRGRRQPAP